MRIRKPRGLVFVGIDPGQSGGIGFLFPRRQESYYTPLEVTRTKHPRAKTRSGKPKVSVKKEYDVWGMMDLLEKIDNLQEEGWRVLVCFEAQRQRPNDSKQVVLTVGVGLGTWQTLLKLRGIEYTVIQPSQWKQRYLPTGATKKESLAMARKLFPKHHLPLEKDECRAEALLMADFLRRRLLELPYPRTPTRKGQAASDKQLRQAAKDHKQPNGLPRRTSTMLVGISKQIKTGRKKD